METVRYVKEMQLARSKKTARYRPMVATTFQEMVRAEAGACQREQAYVTRGKVAFVAPKAGYVVCVTCGRVRYWNTGEMHAGHFLASRSQSILFDERNVAVQCQWCNTDSGRPQQFMLWMRHMYGEAVIEELQIQKRRPKSWLLDELVEMRLSYLDRLKTAKKVIGENA